MISFSSFVFCLVICVLMGLFIRQRAVTELVDETAKRFCRQNEVVFLDGTVQCEKMRWHKSPQTNKWRFYRLYIFEFSCQQIERGMGAIVHEGGRVQQIHFIDDPNNKTETDVYH